MEPGIFKDRVTVTLVDDPEARYDADAIMYPCRRFQDAPHRWRGTLTRVPGTLSLTPIKEAGHGHVHFNGERATFRVAMDELLDRLDGNELRFDGVGDRPSWLDPGGRPDEADPG